jgi:Carboxypeptidase regulatory-like domain
VLTLAAVNSSCLANPPLDSIVTHTVVATVGHSVPASRVAPTRSGCSSHTVVPGSWSLPPTGNPGGGLNVRSFAVLRATITGTVRDPSGAAVPDAKITAINAETGVATTTVSNKEGVYIVAQLREGPYVVTVESIGFSDAVAGDVILVARDIRRLDFSLVVAAIEAKVDVIGGATLIEVETPRISDTRTADQLNTLPLNTRGVYAFLQTPPTLSQRGG